jgi:signal transduction histidine kinase
VIRTAAVGGVAVALLLAAGIVSSGWRLVFVIGGVAGVVVAALGIRRDRQATALEIRNLRRDLDVAVAAADEQRSLQSVLLDSLQVGIAAFRDDRLVFANREARSELGGETGGIDGPWPSAVRSAVEGAGVEPYRIQYESGFPTRTREIVATRVPESDLVVLRIVDVTGRVRSDRMRRDFVAAASHELKTPAAAIQAAAETVLVALDDDVEVARDFAQRVYDQATRLARIVSDLLDLSRLEGGGLEMAILDLSEVVSDEVARLGPTGRRVMVAADPVRVRGSLPDLALALRNLLENAVRYTAAGGVIDVRVSAGSGAVTVVVKDDGVGIPSGDLPRIFERFYRVDDARSRATGGTGLGLAIVKHVAEQHGGHVAVESNLGEGSSFTFVIPVTPDVAADAPDSSVGAGG